MSTYSGSATGRALARLGLLAGRRTNARSGAPAPHETRDRIQSLVEAAPTPLLIDQICEETGLHANTVRGHLDTLVAAGTVTRSPGPRKGRGRPPWLYGAKANSAVAELHRSLREQLDSADADAMAHDAAAAWAEAAHFDTRASTPDEAVQRATASLDELGFAAEASPVGDAIVLHACPYASLIADNPVICDIHAALLGELLDRSGQDVTVASLDVWTRPNMCVAHLKRPDLRPARVVTAPGSTAAKRASRSTKKKRKP